MAQTRQETAFSDPSDLVARRMGFIPLPLGVAIARVLCTTLTPSAKPANIILVFLVYLILVSLRVLISLMMLGHACDIISSHTHSSTMDQKKVFSSKSNAWEFVDTLNDPTENKNFTTPMFSNSSVSLNNVCLNDSLLKKDRETLDRTSSPSKTDLKSENFLVLSNNVVRAGSEPLLSQE